MIEPDTRLADAKLIQTTEQYEETVRIKVLSAEGEKPITSRICVATSEDNVTESDSFDVDVLPFDQWVQAFPESIACFVTPNHPSIAPVLLRASAILGEWTGNSSLEGYQAQDSNRVRSMAGAIFQAIRENGVVYTNPPSSFMGTGQRIRMAGDVLSHHMGTCIDMAVLYASCLEAIGLHPFVVLVEGHAFTGAWLTEKTFPEIIEPDPSQLVNRLSEGIDELFVAECTCLCNHSSESFDQACVFGRKNLLSEGEYIACVDVVRVVEAACCRYLSG